MCVEGADRRQPLLLEGKLRSQLLCFGFPEWILGSGGRLQIAVIIRFHTASLHSEKGRDFCRQEPRYGLSDVLQQYTPFQAHELHMGMAQRAVFNFFLHSASNRIALIVVVNRFSCATPNGPHLFPCSVCDGGLEFQCGVVAVTRRLRMLGRCQVVPK